MQGPPHSLAPAGVGMQAPRGGQGVPESRGHAGGPAQAHRRVRAVRRLDAERPRVAPGRALRGLRGLHQGERRALGHDAAGGQGLLAAQDQFLRDELAARAGRGRRHGGVRGAGQGLEVRLQVHPEPEPAGDAQGPLLLRAGRDRGRQHALRDGPGAPRDLEYPRGLGAGLPAGATPLRLAGRGRARRDGQRQHAAVAPGPHHVGDPDGDGHRARPLGGPGARHEQGAAGGAADGGQRGLQDRRGPAQAGGSLRG
eukprot:438128-Hanusia_phi.AAC.1